MLKSINYLFYIEIRCWFLFVLAVFIFGALTTTILTDILKIMSGRLRPYFLTLCNPDQKSCNGMGMFKNY
jgi:hypothetical protein